MEELLEQAQKLRENISIYADSDDFDVNEIDYIKLQVLNEALCDFIGDL